MSVLNLPTELLTHILIHLNPSDVVHLGQTCRQLQTCVKPTNNFLWHAAFLQIFDNPQHAWSLLKHSAKPPRLSNQHQSEYWYEQIKRRMNTLRALRPNAKSSIEGYGLSTEELIETVLDIVETAKPGPTDVEIARGALSMVDDRRSLNLGILSAFGERWIRLENLIHDYYERLEDEIAPVTGRPTTRSVTAARRSALRSEAASRLHVLYGRTVRERIEYGAKGAARSIVYNWHNAVESNEYGPFKKDHSGIVDWKIVEAIASVMLRHFEMAADGQIVIPQGFCYALPYRTLMDPTAPEDWARVTGRWVGTYSFLDYADLFDFNTETHTYMDLEDTPETHGDLMVLNLKLDMARKDDPRLATNLPVSEDLPKLYFSGTSEAFDSSGQPRLLIHVFGFVSLCPNGREVRWRFIITYRGQEQWQLEGVQPGGIRSGPVFGLWTQWGHLDSSPVGSFMYVPEELCKRQELVLVG